MLNYQRVNRVAQNCCDLPDSKILQSNMACRWSSATAKKNHHAPNSRTDLKDFPAKLEAKSTGFLLKRCYFCIYIILYTYISGKQLPLHSSSVPVVIPIVSFTSSHLPQLPCGCGCVCLHPAGDFVAARVAAQVKGWGHLQLGWRGVEAGRWVTVRCHISWFFHETIRW